ncbi:hypothetical protein [Pseudomonas carnis]|uniref:hypothetical protein n=1 Tax=Pseudomonas carnis TaxID=2487355 RepID=UPI001F38AF7F|nr:hypothetical protein [Pseudomonas carnis]
MSKSFEVLDDETFINSPFIVDAGRFAGFRTGLPEEFAMGAQEKADLLERRLSRIESALGLNPICVP